MSKQARRETYEWTRNIAAEMCANCRYFHQHYMMLNPLIHRNSFEELNCGHCTHGRIKYRKVYDLCEHFESRHQQRGSDHE